MRYFQRLMCRYPGNFVVASQVKFSSRQAPYKCTLAVMKEKLAQAVKDYPGLGQMISIRGTTMAYQSVFCKMAPELVDASLLESIGVELEVFKKWYYSPLGPILPRINWGTF